MNGMLGDDFKANHPIANFLIQTVILTFLILLFGEVIPKLYATNNNVRFATFAASPMQVLSTIFQPHFKLDDQ